MLQSRKHVLISGISRGLGKALWSQFTTSGWRVSGIDRIDPEFQTSDIDFLKCDLGKDDFDLRPFVARGGNFDAVINNAGVAYKRNFFDLSSDELNDTIRSNLLAPIRLTHQVLRLINADAYIVNIGSQLCKTAYEYLPVYTGSKFGLRGFTLALQKLFKQRGCRIKALLVNPGMMNTTIVPEDINKGDATARLPTSDVAKEIYRLVTEPPWYMNYAEVDLRALFSPID